MKTIQLPFIDSLDESLGSPTPLIQVLLGPRQVGKTTSILKYLQDNRSKIDFHYCSADEILLPDESWLLQQYQLACEKSSQCLFVVDEIQKIENWASIVKRIWDRQKREKVRIKFVFLGSSSLQIQKGLKESLAGRFEVHTAHHWNFPESKKAYGVELDDFVTFGGYPESYQFIDDKDKWVNYIRMGIVDTVIGKDILTQAKVKSPSLFKQCFELLISYPAQTMSYTKLLGQLQGKGHVDQIKYYLELFEGAFLVKSLSKYSSKETLKRSSSPKILPLCPAFYGLKMHGEFSSEDYGRAFEVAVGSVLNRLPGDLYYWREGNAEVDFVIEKGKSVYAIEVKSGRRKFSSGPEQFRKKFPEAKVCFVNRENLEKLSREGLEFLEKYAN